jgi:hypothetical protein
MNINNLVQKLGLNTAEGKCISKCINTYSAPFSLKNLLERTWNAVCSLFGRSDWQQAEKIITCKSDLIFRQRHAGQNYNPRAFAEFTLKLFISTQFYAYKQTVYFLYPEKNIFYSPEFVKSIDLDDLLDRACFGNGKDFPMTIPYLRRKLNSEFNSFIQLVDKFEINFNIIQENLTLGQQNELNLKFEKDTFMRAWFNEKLYKLSNYNSKYSIPFFTRKILFDTYHSASVCWEALRDSTAQENRLAAGTSILDTSRRVIEIGKETVDSLKWINNETQLELALQNSDHMKKILENIKGMKSLFQTYDRYIAQAFPIDS